MRSLLGEPLTSLSQRLSFAALFALMRSLLGDFNFVQLRQADPCVDRAVD
jgi:hypothetical protein